MAEQNIREKETKRVADELFFTSWKKRINEGLPKPSRNYA
jgi:hypothetical protein